METKQIILLDVKAEYDPESEGYGEVTTNLGIDGRGDIILACIARGAVNVLQLLCTEEGEEFSLDLFDDAHETFKMLFRREFNKVYSDPEREAM